VEFSTISYEFSKLADLRWGVSDFPQKGPWKDLNPCNWILGRVTPGCQLVAIKSRRGGLTGGEGKVGGQVQELTAVTRVAGVREEKSGGGGPTANKGGRRSSEGRRSRSGGRRVGEWRGSR
jgi:hypothetical protein